MHDDGVQQKYKDKIIRVLSALFPDAKIYLYGSRAKGTHREWSDIDLALDAGKKLERVDVGEARDMFQESNIPYKISVVDFNGVSQDFKQEIGETKVVWKK
ncbi:MAG: nucleotidyltransferase domain-containing protein [Epsilonproteobacteria bacterium]|nr:nucleotidyltransferase domain-containing protein [Campylobacterota bacterium]